MRILHLVLLSIATVSAFQLEAGYNINAMDWSERNLAYSLTVYPFGTSSPEEKIEVWKGLSTNLTYEGKDKNIDQEHNFYVGFYYSKVESEGNLNRVISIGTNFDVLKWKQYGISLRGTTFYYRTFPFSIHVDPKYDFENESYLWDLKFLVGIGKFVPWF